MALKTRCLACSARASGTGSSPIIASSGTSAAIRAATRNPSAATR